MGLTKRTERRDVILVDDKPKFNVGKFIKFKNGKKKEIIRIYHKELQDITLGELEKLGYESPKSFINDWTDRKGTFKVNQVIWIIEFKVNKNEKDKAEKGGE